ncbi:MAG: class I SAM-dependent methyltransferase [Rhodospirillaceae bacterium]
MTRSNYFVDRGMNGNTPALPSRADESFVDYVCEARNVLLHARWKQMGDIGNQKLKEHGVEIEHTRDGVEQARAVIAGEVELASFMRLKRSYQEMYKDRIIDSMNTQRDDWLRKLEEAETAGPGSLTYDADFDMPDYAKVQIHIQPKGYVGDDLAGLFYDCGTQIFFGGGNAGDAWHRELAERTTLPEDGKVDRILEIGCSVGQMACELKKRLPDAEVWATDISAPMVRYGHWRAVQQNVDVNFAQMASEALEFPDNHFDLVAAHILFHEIPRPVIEKTLAEAFRVLRPGGTFVLWDFASATEEKSGYGGILGLMDSADNGEPYAPGFVTMGVEKTIEDAGFVIRSIGGTKTLHDRVCDKPV